MDEFLLLAMRHNPVVIAQRHENVAVESAPRGPCANCDIQSRTSCNCASFAHHRGFYRAV
jgi:hypothetical protein